MSELRLVNYTDKSIVVFGNVSKYEQALRSLGGMYNQALNDSGERKPGFVFTKFKSKEVAAFVANPKECVESKIESKIKDSSSAKEDQIMLSREQFMNLVSSVTRLEQDVAMLKKKLDISSTQTKVAVNPVKESKESKGDIRKMVKKEDEKKSWADEDNSSDNCDNCEEEDNEEEDIDEQPRPSLLMSRKPQPKETSSTGMKSLLLKKK
jgi:hypothetical protein